MMTCKFCGKPESEHSPGMAHRFIPKDGQGKLPQPQKNRPPSDASAPAPQPQGVIRNDFVDLPLRVALLRAGVITPDELSKAEEDVKNGGVLVVVPEKRG